MIWLRTALMALVLENLAFVYITDSASWTWLGPLLVLSLASPLLVRMADSLLYRVAWNGTVLVTFALLVHHVTRAGAEYLLEDGLLLAGLCQVHLLCNITERQKPDILFFNSFLIAVVTSFLCLDLTYSLVFLLYAPTLVVALQLLALTRSGRVPAASAVRRAALVGALRGGLVLGLTLLVFFFWPRDFQRRGALGELRFAGARRFLQVEFNEEIDLSQAGPDLGGDRPVLKLTLLDGVRADVVPYLRGSTLDLFDGLQWKPGPMSVVDRPWRRSGAREWSREGPGCRTRVEIELAAPPPARLFVPLNARDLQLHSPAQWRGVQPSTDLTFHHERSIRDRRVHRYQLGLGADPPVRQSPRPFVARALVHLQLEPRAVPADAARIARKIRDAAPEDAPQAEVVERLRRHLSRRHEYVAPGSERSAHNLAEFLSGRAGGHCEYFATALAVMLRTLSIPCRVVTGYRAGEWNEDGRTLLVRSRNAHAWVEVLDPLRGWYTVDATPAQLGDLDRHGPGWVAAFQRWASDWWQRVTGFDEDRLGAAWNRLLALPPALRKRPGLLGAVCAAAALAVLLWRRLRRRGIPAAVLHYRACLARLKLVRGCGETPRELLRRAGPGMDPERLAELARATRRHEQVRYAGGHLE